MAARDPHGRRGGGVRLDKALSRSEPLPARPRLVTLKTDTVVEPECRFGRSGVLAGVVRATGLAIVVLHGSDDLTDRRQRIPHSTGGDPHVETPTHLPLEPAERCRVGHVVIV